MRTAKRERRVSVEVLRENEVQKFDMYLIPFQISGERIGWMLSAILERPSFHFKGEEIPCCSASLILKVSLARDIRNATEGSRPYAEQSSSTLGIRASNTLGSRFVVKNSRNWTSASVHCNKKKKRKKEKRNIETK